MGFLRHSAKSSDLKQKEFPKVFCCVWSVILSLKVPRRKIQNELSQLSCFLKYFSSESYLKKSIVVSEALTCLLKGNFAILVSLLPSLIGSCWTWKLFVSIGFCGSFSKFKSLALGLFWELSWPFRISMTLSWLIITLFGTVSTCGITGLSWPSWGPEGFCNEKLSSSSWSCLE